MGCMRVNAKTGACSCPGGSAAVVVTGVASNCGTGTYVDTVYTCE